MWENRRLTPPKPQAIIFCLQAIVAKATNAKKVHRHHPTQRTTASNQTSQSSRYYGVTALLLIPLALEIVCFALSPQARANCQEGCFTGANTALGEDRGRGTGHGEIHVYDEAGEQTVETLALCDRNKYPQAVSECQNERPLTKSG